MSHSQPGAPKDVDTATPHTARIYDYYLGGRDWFESDRQAAEAVLAHWPADTEARANRAFMHRATRMLVRERGVRQFLDLGSGIPTEPNLHQVAQESAPQTRVVYVDHDPLVVSHADALLRGTPEGRTAYLEADLRTDDLLQHPAVTGTLDLTEPVAVSLMAVLHFMPDADEPYARVQRLLAGLPSGSHLVLSHATQEFGSEDEEDLVTDIYKSGGISLRLRRRAEIRRFFEGLELCEPGVVPPHEWRPECAETAHSRSFFAAVARKP